MKTNQVKNKPVSVKSQKFLNEPIFTKTNYQWMLIGVALIFVGMILMIGGKSNDSNVFLEKEIYSFRRITLAPILIVAGFLVEIYAILKTNKKETENKTI